MWRIRRASSSIRCHHFRLCLGAQSNVTSYNLDRGVGCHEHGQSITARCFQPKSFSPGPSGPTKFFMGTRHLSLQTHAKGSSNEDALEGFSGLDTSSDIDETSDDVVSEPAVSDGELEDSVLGTAHSELGFSDSEVGLSDDKDSEKIATCKLLMVIVGARFGSVHTALDKWINEGNEVDREEVMIAFQYLQKHHKFGMAMKLTEWVEENNHLNLTEDDYASLANLIARRKGLQQAERFIESRIPEYLRGEVVYGTLLTDCVMRNDQENAERVFDKMRALGFPLTIFAYNQLLVLYKRYNWNKVADFLLLMEKENVRPDLFTYRLLIDIKGLANDILGMELVLEAMKADGVKPDVAIQAAVARHYFHRGHHDKAEAILKEIEGRKLMVNHSVYTDLLRLYSIFGKANEVDRLWNLCEASPQLEEYLEALKAWGRLGNVEKAEAIFEKIVKKWKNVTTTHYPLLLNIYADHKMLAKGVDLVKQMMDNGIWVGRLTLTAFVKLCAECGEVEKADALLQKLPQLKKFAPTHGSYIALLNKYAERGDVHNAERLFNSLRQFAYLGSIQQYDLLLQTYINAKIPAYGFRERLEADGISPVKAFAAKLAKVEASMWEPAENLLG